MPTDLHDAWPDANRPAEFSVGCQRLTSARVATADAPAEAEAVVGQLHAYLHEQTRKASMFAGVVAVLLLCLIAQVDSLKREVRLMAQAQTRRF